MDELDINKETELLHVKIEIENDVNDLEAVTEKYDKQTKEEPEIKKFRQSYSDVNTEQSHGQSFDTCTENHLQSHGKTLDTSTKKDNLGNSDLLLTKDLYPNQKPLYSKSARDIVNGSSINLSNKIQKSNIVTKIKLKPQQIVNADVTPSLGEIQIMHQIIGSNGNIQKIPIQLTSQQLQMIKTQVTGKFSIRLLLNFVCINFDYVLQIILNKILWSLKQPRL